MFSNLHSIYGIYTIYNIYVVSISVWFYLILLFSDVIQDDVDWVTLILQQIFINNRADIFCLLLLQ